MFRHSGSDPGTERNATVKRARNPMSEEANGSTDEAENRCAFELMLFDGKEMLSN